MAQHRMNYQETVSWEPGDTVNSAPHTLQLSADYADLESYSQGCSLFFRSKILPAQFRRCRSRGGDGNRSGSGFAAGNSTAGSIDEVYQLIDSLGIYYRYNRCADSPLLCAIPARN